MKSGQNQKSLISFLIGNVHWKYKYKRKEVRQVKVETDVRAGEGAPAYNEAFGEVLDTFL